MGIEFKTWDCPKCGFEDISNKENDCPNCKKINQNDDWEKYLPQKENSKDKNISEQEMRSDIQTIKAWIQFFGWLMIIEIVCGLITLIVVFS